MARESRPPLEWLWIDTICINKQNAVEETRSINAMFDWYRRAAVCYAYLSDVSLSSFERGTIFQRENGGQPSEWFGRGWTLQELLAPRHMEFYDSNWAFMGRRDDLKIEIQGVTGIAPEYLNGDMKIAQASIATRMSWMAGRVTKEIEDIAYSMIGILDVHMTPQYGEGNKAFMRLQRTLMEQSTDKSIFAWDCACRRDGLLPGTQSPVAPVGTAGRQLGASWLHPLTVSATLAMSWSFRQK